MKRIAVVGWMLLGLGTMTAAARGQVPVEPASDPAGAASAPLPTVPPSPTAKPRPMGPARISGGVMQGNRISFVPPVYPEDARLAKLSGQVVLRVLISKTGSVERVKVMSSSNAVFDAAATDAVQQWMYRPYLLNGEPVEVDSTVTVNFTIGRPVVPQTTSPPGL